MATSRIADHVGRVLSGRYRLLAPIGTGASAHVFVAEDVTLRRRVAVKVLHAALADDESFLRRFRAEAQAAASLSHPHIMQVFDWGEAEDGPFLVLEHLAGGSLRDLLDRGQQLTPAQAAAIGADAAQALDHAHRRGLVHRDIKPANLLFDAEARVRIADFGLARALAEAAWTEPQGAILGTARYASPEQVQGRSVDGKSDVYALALALVEAVTGRVPFAADTTIATLMGRVGATLPVIDALGPLGPLLSQAAAPEPDDRLDAAALAGALAEVAADLPRPAPLPLAGGRAGRAVDRQAPPDDITELGWSPIAARGAGQPAQRDDITELGWSPTADRRTGLGFYDHEADGRPAGPPAGPAAPGAPRLGRAARRAVAAAAETSAPGRRAAAGTGGATATASRVGAAGAASAPRAGADQPAIPLLPAAHKPRRGRRALLVLLVVALLAALAGGGWAVAEARVPSHPVPTLAARDLPTAQRAAAALKLKLVVASRVNHETAPDGQVLTQDPATGSLKEGKAIRVTVSSGPAPRDVPALANLERAAAEKALTDLGLVPQLATVYSATVEKNRVVDWDPKGRQPKGATILITVSDGPAPQPLVDVADQPYEQAAKTLTDAKLQPVRKDVFDDEVGTGKVVSTTPPAGTPVTPGTKITVNVSKGPEFVTVPEVRGKKVEDAIAALKDAGLESGGVFGPPNAKRVIISDPAPGTKARKGSSVRLYAG